MRIFIILLFFSIITDESIGAEFIIVKQYWGDVQLIRDSISKKIDNYQLIKESDQIKLTDSNSKIWIKNHKENHHIIQFSQNLNVFSYSDLKNLLQPLVNTEKQTFANKFLSLISYPKDIGYEKLNGMLISPKTGITRDLYNENLTLLEDLSAIREIPIRLDFSNFFDNEVDKYRITITNNSNMVLFEDFIEKTSININLDTLVSSPLESLLKIEFTKLDTKKSLRGNIKLKFLRKDNFSLLQELVNKALSMREKNKDVYEDLLIDYLVSSNLKCNASYFEHNFKNN